MADINNVQNPGGTLPPVQPQETSGVWKKVGTGAILGLLVILIGASVYYFLYSGKEEVPPPPEVEEVRREFNEISYRNINPDSTTETVVAYVDTLNEMLDDASINQTERMTLLLKKARVLATIRGGVLRGDSAGASNMTEALGILESLYMIDPENDEQNRIRAGVIPIYLHLLVSSCFIPTTAQSLPEQYDDNYSNLIKDPLFPPKAAAILAFREFGYNALPSEYSNDIVTVMWRDYISAVYLHAFAELMTGAENDAKEAEILEALWEDIDRYAALRPVLVNGAIKTEVEPQLYMSYAFDIATMMSSSTISAKRLKEISLGYENALIAADSIEGDETSKASIKILIAIHHLDSIYRLYDEDEIDQELVDKLIDVYIESFNYNKDTTTVFTSYLTEGITAEGSWMPVRAHFYEIAKKNPKLREFIAEKAGINL